MEVFSLGHRGAIHEGIFQSPMQTHSFVESYLRELEQVREKTTPRVSATPRREAERRWIASPPEWVKVNGDGAVARRSHGGAVAAVCRDHTGLYLGSSVVVYNGVFNLTILETYACREAMALASELQVSHMIIASDCQGVVNDINQGRGGSHSAIIQEILGRRNMFTFVSFVHVQNLPSYIDQSACDKTI